MKRRRRCCCVSGLAKKFHYIPNFPFTSVAVGDSLHQPLTLAPGADAANTRPTPPPASIHPSVCRRRSIKTPSSFTAGTGEREWELAWHLERRAYVAWVWEDQRGNGGTASRRERST